MGGVGSVALSDSAPTAPLYRRHLDALRWVEKEAAARGAGVYDVFNFGTGKGSTVFELVHAMERASGQKVLVEVGPRRPGDLTASYADPSKVSGILLGVQWNFVIGNCTTPSACRPSVFWAGKPSTISMPSARTPGCGRAITPRALSLEARQQRPRPGGSKSGCSIHIL